VENHFGDVRRREGVFVFQGKSGFEFVLVFGERELLFVW
jgi:hypothetical protein